ncbi:hypothetical protein [Brevibacillus sp. JB24b]
MEKVRDDYSRLELQSFLVNYCSTEQIEALLIEFQNKKEKTAS